MKFSCNVLALKSALDIVGKAVDARPFNPLLTCIKVECEDGKLKVTANNLTTAITTAIPIESEEDGAACLPCDFLRNIVSKIEKEHDISIAVDENLDATISWAKGRFELKAIDPDEFPEFPEVEEAARVLPPEFLKHISFASRFASNDETKQVLTGVSVGVAGGKLTALATDGNRLGVSSGDVAADDFSLLIPGSTVRTLGSISNGDIEIKSNGSQMLFKSGDSQISVRALGGQYPDCLSMIPSEFEHEIIMNGKELKAAIDRVLIADSGSKTLIFRFGESIFAKVETPPGDGNRASEDVMSSAVSGSIAVGIHAPYLQPALPDREFLLCINAPDKPIVLREKEGCRDWLALIMPVQIRS